MAKKIKLVKPGITEPTRDEVKEAMLLGLMESYTPGDLSCTPAEAKAALIVLTEEVQRLAKQR